MIWNNCVLRLIFKKNESFESASGAATLASPKVQKCSYPLEVYAFLLLSGDTPLVISGSGFARIMITHYSHMIISF